DLSKEGPTLPHLVELRGEPVSCADLKSFMRSDYRLVLADDFLPKMDMATMANSLEARSPFLDVPLAEFAWSLPERWLISPTRTKPLLRDLARPLLPAGIVSAPKRGFEVPMRRWLAQDLRDVVVERLRGPGCAARGRGRAAPPEPPSRCARRPSCRAAIRYGPEWIPRQSRPGRV